MLCLLHAKVIREPFYNCLYWQLDLNEQKPEKRLDLANKPYEKVPLNRGGFLHTERSIGPSVIIKQNHSVALLDHSNRQNF